MQMLKKGLVSKLKITFSDSALYDLEDIEAHYTDLGVAHISTKLISNIISNVELLYDNPDMGRMVPEFNVNDIRELLHKPYRIIYLREPNKITVIRIWRSERLLNLHGTPAQNKI